MRTRARVSQTLVTLVLFVGLSGPAAAQSTTPVLFDRHMTIGAGATVSQALGEAIARAEDAFIPVRLFEERGASRRTANFAYRFLKLTFFDVPQEQLIWVTNHEVFGHGARLRERFDGSIDYEIDAPAPYGDGGGLTRFSFDRAPTIGELLAIDVAGMEASAVAADVMAGRAVADGRMTPRDAIRYIGFELDTFTYILRTGDEPEDDGHDVSDFLQAYNEVVRVRGGSALQARTLRREALGILANPMLGYAIYGIGRHLLDGSTDVRVPSLKVGGVRYLPMVRYRLTPYGTEWALTNEIAASGRAMQIELRLGRAPAAKPWGVAVEGRELASWRQWRLNAAADVWRQPLFFDASESTSAPARMGAQLRLRAERALIPVWFGTGRATAIVEVGAKSAGFVPGEPLGAGVTVRAGVGLPFRRR